MLQTELHRHLDVSLRLSTLLELAQKAGLEGESTSLESFREKVIISKPMTDLATVLDQFRLFQKVLRTPETLERVAFEAVEDCYREGTRRVELRFSPSFVAEYNGLDWDGVVERFYAGLSRGLRTYPDMEAGLICIASRDFGVDAAVRTAELYLRNRDKLIGMDLAGPETGYPNPNFASAFDLLAEAAHAPPHLGLNPVHVTIHAGEAEGPDNIWSAIEDLGAERIGHGIRCLEDPQLVDFLSKKQICLEICPTSNWLTRCSPRLEDHPLPRLLEQGVPVSINTDDPGIFGLTLPHELEVCRKNMGMSDDEIQTCLRMAERASFLEKKH